MAEEFKTREPEDRVSEWEVGLPTSDDLTPLSQNLIPPELAAAFSITPEPHRSILELNREAQNTLSSLSGSLHSNFKAFADESEDPDPDGSISGSESRKIRRLDSGVEEAEIFNDDLSAKTQKRPRLVWTPQLHKRFVDVVAHLGIKNAVPKIIMQLMNVEGLTRENVASHLQKYRLYLKRMSGLSNDGPSPSDHLFASTPVPQSLQEPALPMPMPMTYPQLMMPYGIGQGNTASSGAYHGYKSHPYHMVQQRDWSGRR